MVSVTISMTSASIGAQADALVRLDIYIKNVFARKEHGAAVFFDLEKAFDTTWRRVILLKLMKIDFKGHLLIFIQDFLSDRQLKVRIGRQFYLLSVPAI